MIRLKLLCAEIQEKEEQAQHLTCKISSVQLMKTRG